MTISQQETEEETVQTGVRIPVLLKRRIRKIAIDLGISAGQVVTDGMEEYLEKLERRLKRTS